MVLMVTFAVACYLVPYFESATRSFACGRGWWQWWSKGRQYNSLLPPGAFKTLTLDARVLEALWSWSLWNPRACLNQRTPCVYLRSGQYFIRNCSTFLREQDGELGTVTFVPYQAGTLENVRYLYTVQPSPLPPYLLLIRRHGNYLLVWIPEKTHAMKFFNNMFLRPPRLIATLGTGVWQDVKCKSTGKGLL